MNVDKAWFTLSRILRILCVCGNKQFVYDDVRKIQLTVVEIIIVHPVMIPFLMRKKN